MPIYNFACSCGHTFDQSKKIADRDNVSDDVCPSCSEVGKLTRQVGAPLVAYSVITPGGYGKIPDGFKEVLKNINRKSGVRGNPTSSFM